MSKNPGDRDYVHWPSFSWGMLYGAGSLLVLCGIVYFVWFALTWRALIRRLVPDFVTCTGTECDLMVFLPAIARYGGLG